MLRPAGKAFSASTIVSGNAMDFKALTPYIEEFALEKSELKTQWKQLLEFWPFGDQTSNQRRMKAGYPKGWFFEFAVGALKCHPAGPLNGIRKGSEALHLAGVFLAAYFRQNVTRSYFDVCRRQIFQFVSEV
jgi:hypothetical protein